MFSSLYHNGEALLLDGRKNSRNHLLTLLLKTPRKRPMPAASATLHLQFSQNGHEYSCAQGKIEAQDRVNCLGLIAEALYIAIRFEVAR